MRGDPPPSDEPVVFASHAAAWLALDALRPVHTLGPFPYDLKPILGVAIACVQYSDQALDDHAQQMLTRAAVHIFKEGVPDDVREAVRHALAHISRCAWNEMVTQEGLAPATLSPKAANVQACRELAVAAAQFTLSKLAVEDVPPPPSELHGPARAAYDFVHYYLPVPGGPKKARSNATVRKQNAHARQMLAAHGITSAAIAEQNESYSKMHHARIERRIQELRRLASAE